MSTLAPDHIQLLLRDAVDKDVRLRVVAGDSGAVRDVVVRPISSRRDAELRYRSWEIERRRRVEEASGGSIGYLHLRGLGTPKEGRLAARSGNYDALEKVFAKHLKTPEARENLDELSELVKKAGPVCLLCYERNHEHCHRRWIAEIIEERDGGGIENLAAPQI